MMPLKEPSPWLSSRYLLLILYFLYYVPASPSVPETVQNYCSFMSCVLTLPPYWIFQFSYVFSLRCFTSLLSFTHISVTPTTVQFKVVSQLLSISCHVYFLHSTLWNQRHCNSHFFFFFSIWKSSLALTLQVPVLPFPVTINLRKITLTFWDLVS